MKTVIVTGTSQGIGTSIVKALSNSGFEVIATSRNLEKIKDLFNNHKNIQCYELDVMNTNSIKSFYELIKNKNVDAIVHNAGGGYGDGLIKDSIVENWEKTYRLNVLGPLEITSTILPILYKSKNAQIILITSMAGYDPFIGGAPYCVAKAAEISLSKSLRIDLAKNGIKVTQIAPGSVDVGDREKINALKPEDIAETVRWILTLPKHVNVQNLDIMHISEYKQ